jgi:hypothetical protein
MSDYLAAERAKPKLRLIECAPRKPDVRMDDISREMHYRRIRYYACAYRLQWLVDQACFDCVNIEDLSDDDLIALHRDMDRARECPHDDVSFEDAGLVRSRA